MSRWLATALLAFAVAATAGIASTQAASTTASTVVTAEVLSATNLDVATGCAADVADVTAFGQLLPGTSNVTGTDCVVEFGSSNDTAMVRAYQTDRIGSAMFLGADASLDTSFGGDGFIQVDTGADEDHDDFAGTWQGGFGATAMQPDGMVLYGFKRAGIWALARFDQAGALDTAAFGAPNGYVTFPAMSGSPTDIAVQADGKIIVVGDDGGQWASARVHASGALDTNVDADPAVHWNTTGTMSEDLGAGTERARTVVVQSSGRVITSGHVNSVAADYVRAYTVNGALDTTFASPDGFINNMFGYDYITDVLLGPSDEVTLLASRTACGGCGVAIGKLLPDGATDTTFSPGGTPGIESIPAADLDPAATWLAGYDLAVDSSSNIYATFHVLGHATQADFGIVRLTPLGAPDGGFAGDGSMYMDIGTGDDFPTGLAIDSLDRPTVLGTSSPGSFRGEPFIARVNTDGTPDTTFNSGAAFAVHIPPGNAGLGTLLSDLVDLGDGSYMGLGEFDAGGAWDLMLAKFGSTPVDQYLDLGGGSDRDWSSGPANDMFAACLRSVAGAGVGGAWTVDGDNDCTTSDTDPWYAIDVDGTGPDAKVGESTTAGLTTATISLRFGFRTATDQAPGTYTAPITFETVAPNV